MLKNAFKIRKHDREKRSLRLPIKHRISSKTHAENWEEIRPQLFL